VLPCEFKYGTLSAEKEAGRVKNDVRKAVHRYIAIQRFVLFMTHSMKQILFIVLSTLILAGCEDNFIGPERPPGTASSGEVIYTAIDYSKPNYWQFGGIRVVDMASGMSRIVVATPSYLLCAPQSGRIAYIEFDHANPTISLKTAKSSGLDEQLIQVFSNIGESVSDRAALSPDGKKIAYVVNFDNGLQKGYKLMLYDVETELAQEIDGDEIPASSGRSAPLIAHISFSPSGTYFAAVKCNGSGYIQVYMSSGGGKTSTFSMTGPHFSWASDGNHIVYTENPDLYIYAYGAGNLNLTWSTSTPTRVKKGNVTNGSSESLVGNLSLTLEVLLSHDGKRIAVSQPRDNFQGGMTDIISFTLDAPHLLDTLTVGFGEGYRETLQWSDDDAYMLYTSSSNPVMGAFYSEVLRVAIKKSGRSEQVVQRLAYGGYWNAN